MVLTKEAQVTIVPMNINNFVKLGYENLQLFKKTTIKVQHLGKKSIANILVKCDICGLEKNNSYRNYIESFEKENCYCCSAKCSDNKRKRALLKNYGVDNPFKSESIKQNIKNNLLIKFGVEYPMQN